MAIYAGDATCCEKNSRWAKHTTKNARINKPCNNSLRRGQPAKGDLCKRKSVYIALDHISKPIAMLANCGNFERRPTRVVDVRGLPQS